MEQNKHKAILVTGATGFVGAYLCHYLLQQGYTNIRATRRPSSSMALLHAIESKIDWHICDVLDIGALEDGMQGVEQVYHCAAIVSFDPSDTKEMYRVNVEGTANVVNIAQATQVKKLLHVSSIAAIGRKKQGEVLTETSKWEKSPFNTHYGKSKFMAEREVWRGQVEGLNTVIINPAIILGAGYWHHGPTRFFPLIAKGFRFYPTGTGNFVDVRDVVRMMVQLMESDITEQRFIAHAEDMPYQTFFQLIAKNLDVKAPSVKIVPFLREIAWRMAWLQARLTGKSAFITRETARQSSRSFYYNHQKSVEQLDFQYRPIEHTIAETAQLYQEAARKNDTPLLLPFR